MPRLSIGEKLDKVVSTTITSTDFEMLKKYAKIRYNQDYITQPTISHLLRAVIRQWANVRRKEEAQTLKKGA